MYIQEPVTKIIRTMPQTFKRVSSIIDSYCFLNLLVQCIKFSGIILIRVGKAAAFSC